MSKKANLLMNLLIIILIIILVFVMMNYYADTPSTIPNEVEVIQNEIIPNNNNESIITNNSIIHNKSGDKLISISDSGEIEINSGEGKKEDLKQDNLEDNKENPNEQITKNENPTVIMTSENEISNKEKKEVLTELDKTLMELLDVVDKVQTVDETRLIIDLSEVQ